MKIVSRFSIQKKSKTKRRIIIMSKSLNDKINANNEQIQKLKNEQRKLLQKQKAEAEKAKKQRLFNRGAYLEKIAPHIAKMSESEYENYISKITFPEIKLAPPPAEMQGGILTETEVTEDDEE
jgi:hypothetical protein